jgi:RNA polymerase sigma-70 factor (ECF subfamily)
MLGAVLEHYAGCESVSVQLELLRVLHVEELVLARACAAGNVAAWEDFMRFYPSRLYETAYQIARDKVAGRELADGLYAELWGLRVRGSNRISKLDSYMGRGSLGGWLRAVLAQRYIDRVRSCAKDVSLEERVDRFDGGFSHTMYFFDGRHGYRFTMASPDSERFEAVAV